MCPYWTPNWAIVPNGPQHLRGMEDDILEKQSMKIQFHTHSDFSQGDKQEGRGILFHRFPVKCFEMIFFSSQFLVRTGELTSENLEIQQPGMVVLDHWSTIDRVSCPHNR